MSCAKSSERLVTIFKYIVDVITFSVLLSQADLGFKGWALRVLLHSRSGGKLWAGHWFPGVPLTQLLNICEWSGHSEQVLSLAVTGSWKLSAQHGLCLSADPRSGHWSPEVLLDVLAQLRFGRTHTRVATWGYLTLEGWSIPGDVKTQTFPKALKTWSALD